MSKVCRARASSSTIRTSSRRAAAGRASTFSLHYLLFILIGIVAGICSGVFGIGGGVVMVPMMILLLKYPQHMANGTSLVAMLLPVGLLGVIEYYRDGKIGPTQLRAGFLIAIGIFVGALVGAKIAVALPEKVLKRAFAIMLMFVAGRLWWSTR